MEKKATQHLLCPVI